jgi:predicted anti-sigma-YlaC factor YlaD
MNCDTLERLLLLDQSGELPAGRRADLAAHLAACADCRARHDELAAFARFLDAGTATDGPAEAVIARIMTAAGTERPARRRGILRLVGFPTLAAAAALVLLLGLAGWSLRRPATAHVQAAGAARVAEVSSLLAMLLDHDPDAAASHAAAASGDLRGFACQLLILEGLSEDVFEAPADDATRLEERQPTTLQWRNSPADPAEKCA